MARLLIDRRSKYGAEPTTIDGIRFASKAESKRYQELCLMQAAGEIRGLECQYRVDLHVGTLKIGSYVADFTYAERLGNVRILEDVKGVRTSLYRWKRKHVLAEYGIEILET